MTRTLYLHVGPSKTGTSAIQHVLRHHDGSIVLYPKVGLWGDGSHHNLVLNFFRNYTRPEVVREDAEALFARIGEAARASDRDLVISSEILAGPVDVAEFVQALLRDLGANHFRVEFLVVVREHFERAASVYNQRVKDAVSSETRDPDRFLVEHAPKLGYATMLRRLDRTGFDVTVVNYHPAERFVALFLAHLGFAPGQVGQTSRRNVSLGKASLIATLMANRTARDPEERERLVSTLRKIPRAFAPSNAIFGSAASFEAEEKFAADRRFLRKQFGVKLPVPEIAEGAEQFVLGDEEFETIAAATRHLGDCGSAFAKALRPYAQTPMAIARKRQA